MKSILDSYAEEFDDEHNQQDQESNIGLVIDGEVRKHFSADTVYAHLQAVCTGGLMFGLGLCVFLKLRLVCVLGRDAPIIGQ